MTHLNFTQMLRICLAGHLIGIKRKPCEVFQIPNGTSLNSDIMRNFPSGNLKITPK